jgi:hypothetical protein
MSSILSFIMERSLPTGDLISVEGTTTFVIDRPLFYRKVEGYSDLCEVCSPGVKNSQSIRPLEYPVHCSVFSIIYSREHFYVLARLDQQPKVFDVSSLFENIRPLKLKLKIEAIEIPKTHVSLYGFSRSY